MQQQSVRPISTYDNLSASASNTSTNASKPKAIQQQICSGESSGQLDSINNKPLSMPQTQPKPQLLPQSYYENENSSLRCDSTSKGPSAPCDSLTATAQQATGLNDTSHSIAAVKAALSDAKSKFFGINNYDALDETFNSQTQIQEIKPEPKYQNVPQSVPARSPILAQTSDLQPMKTTIRTSTPSPDKSLRYGATYEQIPLSDLDAPQPSQAVYMSTTVPQNMKGIKIAGRHTPTRNSLRHSRMIVVNNKTQDNIQKTYSAHMRNLNFSRQLLILQLAIGLLIVGLAVWILILAPNASILINPYLSGLSLLLASIAGIILLGRDRRSEYQRSHNNCYKVLLAESYVFSILALIFCCLALVCAAIEFSELTSTFISNDGTCGPTTSSLLSYRNCTCFPEATAASNLLVEDDTMTINSSNSTSRRENCDGLRGEWKYLLAFSMALNTVGILATFLYITVFICCHRNSRKHLNTYI